MPDRNENETTTATDESQNEEEHGFWRVLDDVALTVKAIAIALFAPARTAGTWFAALTAAELGLLTTLATLAIVLPAFGGAIGIGIGCYGHHKLASGMADWWHWIEAGRWMIAIAGIVYCALTTYFMVRSGFWVEVYLFASEALSKALQALPVLKWVPIARTWRVDGKVGWHTDGILPQAQEREKSPLGESMVARREGEKDELVLISNQRYRAKRFIRKVMGVCLAMALAFAYAFVFAVYESPELFMVAIVAGFALAFAIVHFELRSPTYKWASLIFIALVLIGATLSFGYGLIRDEEFKAKHELRQVYASEYHDLAADRRDLVKAEGVAVEIEGHPQHGYWIGYTQKMEYIEAKRPPATPVELAVWSWRNIRGAGYWSRDQVIAAPESYKDFIDWTKKFDLPDPFKPDPNTKGTPLDPPPSDGDEEETVSNLPATDSEPSDPDKEAKKKALLAKIAALNAEAEESHQATKDLQARAKDLGITQP